jgi:hypothetical protein
MCCLEQALSRLYRAIVIADGNEISIATGVIAAIAIGSLTVGVLIGGVCIWLVLKRKRTVTGTFN